MTKPSELEAAWKAWEERGEGGALARALARAGRAAARRVERRLGERLAEVAAAGCREGARAAAELLDRARRHVERAGEHLAEEEREAERLVRERHELDLLFAYLDPLPGRDGAAMGRWRRAVAEFDHFFRRHLDDFVGALEALQGLKARRGFASWAARRLAERAAAIRLELKRAEPWVKPLADAMRRAVSASLPPPSSPTPPAVVPGPATSPAARAAARRPRARR